MDIQTILVACLIGLVAGWLASLVIKGGGSGLVPNLLIGLVGGLIGYWLIPKTGLPLPSGIVGAILTAFIGAVILLLLIRLIVK